MGNALIGAQVEPQFGIGLSGFLDHALQFQGADFSSSIRREDSTIVSNVEDEPSGGVRGNFGRGSDRDGQPIDLGDSDHF